MNFKDGTGDTVRPPHEAALADAAPYDPGPYGREPRRCGALGPGGECGRPIGHTDYYPGTAHQQDFHYSYDTDRYCRWPVGWESEADIISRILDPDFGTDPVASLLESIEVLDEAGTASVSSDFVAGWNAALDLVRTQLRRSLY